MFKKQKYLKNVVSLSVDREICTGCAMCVDVCPHKVLSVVKNKAIITDRDACMECGACKKNCPVSAINVNEGVGCAAYLYNAMLNKNEEVSCGSASGGNCCDKM